MLLFHINCDIFLEEKKVIPLFKSVLQKGGLKLKLIGFMTAAVLLTVLFLSSSIINLMKDSIESKAYEVATTTIDRISDFSFHALLERTYENQLNLDKMLQDIKYSKVEGLVDVSIYERKKDENETEHFQYLSGFGLHQAGDVLEDQNLLAAMKNAPLDTVSRQESVFRTKTDRYETYRFIKPISFNFQGERILLGISVLHYDKDAITGIVDRVIRVAIGITLLIVLVMVGLLYLAGLRFSRPILQIADAATAVSQGNLDIRLDIQTHDEIEVLADKFNNMVRGLREREKMQKFVSDSTMDMIQENESCRLVLGGEYRELTFLFSDIRGFTAMSETKKPDEIVEIINHYLHVQTTIIKSYQGDIDKYVGDEIMAFFTGEDGPERAVKCADEIQCVVANENIRRKESGETVCEVGIGVNHGEVVVGNIGSHNRMDFTSIGSAVNLAARLCSQAKANEVLIEAKTYRMTSQNYKTRPMEPVTAKGFSQPIEVVSITKDGK